MDGPFLSGTASLAEHLDRPMMCVLRDGRHLIGTLRSFDHFSNLVLEATRERHFAAGEYCDIDLGLYLVRGENIVFVGEMDLDKDGASNPLRPGDIGAVLAAEAEEEKAAAALGKPVRKQQWCMD